MTERDTRKRKKESAQPAAKKARKDVSRQADVVPPHLAAREAAFPRGGGTGLSQVEHRQAVLEGRRESAAANDLFAEKGGRKRTKSATAPTKGRKKAHAATPTTRDTQRVELLNYKRLVPGTRVLASILAVHPLALVVSFADQLVGHVPVTHISSAFSERMQQALDEDEPVPELRDMYTPGQWVCACVENIQPAGARRQWGLGRESGEYERDSQRVRLSMDPTVVNAVIAAADIAPGLVLPAAVTSAEDHGYALELGVNGDIHGFLPNTTGITLPIGAVIQVTVDRVSGRVAVCRPVDKTPSPLGVAPSQAALLPGVCVRALVTSTTPQGVTVSLYGMFDGTIDAFHLPGELTPGKKLAARVLWQMPAEGDASAEVGARRIGLSAAEHVLHLDAPLASNGRPLVDAFPIGTRVTATVSSVNSAWGLLCNVEGAGTGFVHISRVADEHVDALSPTSGAYRVGSEHEARVVGHAPADRVLLLSLQPSVLAKDFMRVSEVNVGDVVRATIRRVTDRAIFLRLNGNVDGVVFPLHFADILLRNPEKKYKPNAEVRARVLHTDPERNRIVLSLKRTLVDSDLPLVSSVDQAVPGLVTLAVVTRHLQRSILVELGGTVRAVVPYTEAGEEKDLTTQFPDGRVVRVRITRVERETGRVTASIKQATPSALAKLDVASFEIGSNVVALVKSVHDAIAVCEIEPQGTKALLALSALARLRKVDTETIAATIQPGDRIEDTIVVDRNPTKGLVVLGDKIRGALSPGTKCRARVVRRCSEHLFSILRIGSSRARIHVTEVSDDFSTAHLPDEGEEIDVVVLEVHDRDAEVSSRASRLYGGNARDPAIDSAADLEIGAHYRGVVKAVRDTGVYVSLGRNTDARVMIKELFDEYVKDFKARLRVGEVVNGTVLGIDGGKVEFSLKKSRLGDVKTESRPTRLEEFSAGDKVSAIVRSVTDYGVFVEIEGTKVSGLCHKSELADSKSADALRAYESGDRVKAVVLKVEPEKRRISFGLKPSYFEDDDDLDGDDDDEAEDEDEDDVDEEDLDEGDEDLDDAEDVDESDEDNVDVEENALAGQDSDNAEDDSDSSTGDFIDLGDESDAGEQDDDESDTDDESPTKPALEAKLSWDAPAPVTAIDSDDEDDAPRIKKRRGVEEDITGDLAEKKLDSATDYERLLLGSPNSSYLWIQFMSFYLELGDVEKARQVARRAIQVINYREEQEKLNVWVALLNLENTYGSPDTLEAVFREAVQLNDAYSVHTRLLAILEQSGKIDQAAELFRKTVKKFGANTSAWIAWYQFYLRHGRPDDAHELVPRSLQSLERSKHIKALAAYALAEYKQGDIERARTLFETLVSRHPKRLDLWWQYIDQEVHLENIESVRSLLDRVFVERKNTVKQTKSLLQKWLAIEKRIGDDAGVQGVLERAREFVARTQASARGGGDEQEDEDNEDE
ncbi:rRNA biogenesis protein rrp5 [Malassezia cuniculi]|uniref:rRNA biogenesis protein rrp5 n=1 Tax=Malassezia cuniculi TaxID=948313 RepID=A0AAF0F166_9BASI|nr:rRNA biogenesis protein rrp5 [Malassezia cuniculi]